MVGLREQYRRTAMREIQERALDLFDERGFDGVTIEAVAAAAGVSASSVYRYFGTKEGLLAIDEFDAMSDESLVELLDPADPVGSLVRVVSSFERSSADRDAIARRRIRYFFEVPSVRTAALATLDRAAERLAPMLAAGGRLGGVEARVTANALAFGYFAALEQWYREGASGSIADVVAAGLAPLRTVWAQAD